MNRAASARAGHRGLTLVELMVALALGLLLVGSAATLVLARLDAQRRLLADLRLARSLDVVTDLSARELRRAGHWGRADDAIVPMNGAGMPDGAVGLPNPHIALQPDAPSPPAVIRTTPLPAWSYGRVSTDHPDLRDDLARDPDETAAIRLNGSTQALDLRLSGPALAPGSGDSWQALTDPQRLRLTRWQVSRSDRTLDLLAHCPRTTCPADDADCPPRLLIRQLVLDADARDPSAPDRTLHLRRAVRVRADELRGHCPAP